MKNMKQVLASVMAVILAIGSAFALPGVSYAADGEDTERFGTIEEYATSKEGLILKDDFYYDDAWFIEKTGLEENLALALMSMQLTASALDNDDEDCIEESLSKLGFGSIVTVDLGPDDDGVGYTYGTKTIGEDVLAAVVIHSSSLDNSVKKSGWTQNFTVNGESAAGEHYGFKTAASRFDAAGLISSMQSTAGSGGRLKFWVMGQSRGGAIANLVAAKLLDYAASPGDVYAYTFEAPANVDADAIDTSKDYSSIHNYFCGDDIVTMIPPWGMTRYGVSHDLIGELEAHGISNADVNEELVKLGSEMTVHDHAGTDMLSPAEIMDALISRIPTRAAYSADNTDTFTKLDGSVVTVEYSYQEVFRNLMGVVFGEEGIPTAGIVERLEEAFTCLESLVRGYMIESGNLPQSGFVPDAYYWDSAVRLTEFLDSLDDETGNPLLGETTLYALLKLLAPVAVRTDPPEGEEYTITDEPMSNDAIIEYISPILDTVASKDEFMESHHFDTLVARLKKLAPHPDMADLDITIPAPAAGDASTKTPGRLVMAVNDLGYSWLGVSSKWDSKDKALKRNKEYYLDVEFEVVGHSIPEDLSLTINSQAPVRPFKVTYENGVATISATWKYTIGVPGECTLTFDTWGHGDAPEPITVKSGERLKFVDLPVLENDGEYRFDGWFDVDNKAADDITVTEDMFLFAGWTQIIDKVELTWEIPKAGETTLKPPTVPKGSPYHLSNFTVMDSTYEDVEVIPGGELIMSVNVVPEEGADFLLETDDYGWKNYVGTVTLNGEEIDVNYDDSGGYIRIEYYCESVPKDAEPPAPDAGTGEDGTALGRGATADAADKFLTAFASDSDPAGAKYAPLRLKSTKQTKASVKLSWNKASGAAEYVVYGNLTGKTKKLVKLASVKKNTYTVKKIAKKLKKGKSYKFIVVALDSSRKVVSTSSMIHAATSGSAKAANYKSVKVTKVGKAKGKKALKVTLKTGRTAKIKEALVKPSKKVKVKSILKTRYASSNEAVAKVTAKGTIRAAGKGTCKVYVYAQNGVSKVIKVTVK